MIKNKALMEMEINVKILNSDKIFEVASWDSSLRF
jgi:hypothetical protein